MKTLIALFAVLASPLAFAQAPADNLKIVLLGTGVGPPINLQQFGASTLIEAGSVRLLFDCGRGTTLRLAQVGVPLGSINRVLLTHLHSDHVVQLPDLLLTGWVGGGRRVPLEVWGPEGTREMMGPLQGAEDMLTIDVGEKIDVRTHEEEVRRQVLATDDRRTDALRVAIANRSK